MIVITKRNLFIILILVLAAVVSAVFIPIISTGTVPRGIYTVVIDAGHGGQDGGCVGRVTKVTESYLNLKYAKDLESRLLNFGIKVVMTRNDMNGLYSPFAANKKKSEMQKRKEIIDNSAADFLISIHMNSFPTRSSRGVQAFYKRGSDSGKQFATTIQNVFCETIKYARKNPGEGDYFILNCTEKPAVLIECGFLSNPEEEALLVSDEYMYDFNAALIAGILAFIGR